MDFRYVDAFLAVMRYGNFSAASTHLNIAVSAVSRQVTLLESSLGTVLFTRSTRTIRPTPASEKLNAYLLRLLSDVSILHGGAARRSVSVGTLQSVFENKVIKLFGDTFLTKRYAPRLEINTSRNIVSQVSTGAMDVGIISETGTHHSLEKRLLYTEDFVWYGHAGPDLPLIVCEPFEDVLGREFFVAGTNVLRVNSFNAAKMMADRGLGRTILPVPSSETTEKILGRLSIVMVWNPKTCQLSKKDLGEIERMLS